MTRVWPARVLFGLGVAGFPIAKALQMAHWCGCDTARQLLLVGLGSGCVALVARHRLETLGWSQVAQPRPPLAQWVRDPRLGRLALGGVAVVCCGASVGAGVAANRVWTLGLTAAALIPLGALAAWEAGRHLHWKATAPGGASPDRAVLWAVAPAVLLWTVLVVQGAVRGNAFEGDLGDHTLFLDGALGQALFTVVVIGFGEEYLFRALLLALAVRARLEAVGLTLISLSFGAWHIPDAWPDGAGTVVATVVGMTAVSQFVLLPVRLRCRSLAGPALLHAGNNLALRMLGAADRMPSG